MASLTEKDLGTVNTSASATLYTVPGATRAIVRTCRVTNKDATNPVTVKILYRLSGVDYEYDSATLVAGARAEFMGDGNTLEMPAGGILKINLSAGISCDVVLTGVEVT